MNIYIGQGADCSAFSMRANNTTEHDVGAWLIVRIIPSGEARVDRTNFGDDVLRLCGCGGEVLYQGVKVLDDMVPHSRYYSIRSVPKNGVEAMLRMAKLLGAPLGHKTST